MQTTSISSDRLVSKIAICVLARGYKTLGKYKLLVERNNSINEVIINESKAFIDVLIFHEGNIDQTQQQYISINSDLKNIKFISVESAFKKNSHVSSKYCSETKLSKSYGHGYKCMCKFWFSEFLNYTKEYDYVIRIDDDCVIQRFPVDEIIKKMKGNKIRYVAASIFGNDDKNVTLGIENLCNDFIKENKIQAKPRFDYNPYTNIFIIDADYFRTNEIYQRFSSLVNSTGCIFINRWGDHVLWGAILSILPGNNIFKVDADIQYLHGSHNKWINSNINKKTKFGILGWLSELARKIRYKILTF